jgi:alpha-N-arabinofuranosidase
MGQRLAKRRTFELIRMICHGNIAFLLAVCLWPAFSGNAQNKAPKKVAVTIDATRKKDLISDKLFGMFMENLGNEDVGNLIDDCLWAELLDDRKFFYPIDTIAELVPKNRKQAINQWKPVAGQSTVVMDTAEPYAGAHSPKIITTADSENGILQTGIALLASKKYTGRIVLNATAGLDITVSLLYGNGANESQSIHFSNVGKEYTTYDFNFTPAHDFAKGTLKITGKGNGSFHIGAVSLMPADNIDGFRPEVISLLKGLHSGIYRWGGNFISAYDWRDGVGDPDKRAPRYEYAWECLEDNDVGTAEMIRFAQLVNVDLAMTVNTGFGDAYSAAQWVEYVNGSENTEMGKLRSANGHPKPFGITYWCVGNESYGWWQLGHLPLKQYIVKHNMFADKMLEKDPSIQLIGSGAAIEEMTVTENGIRTNGKVIPDYLSETDWTGGMLKDAHHISFMSEHLYCSVTGRFDLTQAKYVEVPEPLEDWTRRPANRIKSKALEYAEYHKRIPGSAAVPVYLDEWAYYTNWVHPKPTLGVAIGYARGLHELFRHTDLFKMAGFTFGTSCLSFTDTSVEYNASGLLFKLYQSQFGRTPIQVDGNSPQPSPAWPIGGDQPIENAGGNAYPLDIVAAITPDGKAITVAIVNPTESRQTVAINFVNAKTASGIKKWTISGTSVDARNIINEKPGIALAESVVKLSKNEISIDAATINILRFELIR